jgi:hypothetical protein
MCFGVAGIDHQLSVGRLVANMPALTPISNTNDKNTGARWKNPEISQTPRSTCSLSLIFMADCTQKASCSVGASGTDDVIEFWQQNQKRESCSG